MPRVALFLARFCSSAWIGAAVLFVIVGVREVTRGNFDAATKDALVALRFPAFYFAGGILVGTALIGASLAGKCVEISRRRQTVALCTLTGVLAVMVLDYQFIYQPLLEMVTPPGVAKTADFKRYHDASKYVNMFGLSLMTIATMALNWPARLPLEACTKGEAR